MKKVLACVLISFVFFTANTSANELIFNTQDFPPFNYLENGRVVGPAAEIIRLVCRSIEVRCSFNLMVWKDAQNEVRQGKAHAMFVIGWNKKRTEWLYFSPQIMQTEYGFFVAEGNGLSYSSPLDIQGYKVGVYGPSNTARSLEKIKKKMERNKAIAPIEIDLKPDDILVFKDLSSSNRTIKAAYSNRDVGNAIIRNNRLSGIRYAGTQRKLDYYIGFAKAHVEKSLVNRFNKMFIQLYKNGEINKILNKYQMQQSNIEPHIISYYSRL